MMVARHTHPGIESAYVLEGGFELPIQGQPTRTIKPGDGFQIPPETPHAGGITYVVEKGKPLASPALTNSRFRRVATATPLPKSPATLAPHDDALRARVAADPDITLAELQAWLLEQFFAKLKALLRKVAARTIEALIAAIAEALTKVSPQECENYLANQGYRRQL
jgi:hypothetical protein